VHPDTAKMVTNHGPHPFDPITPEEIKLAVRILEATFPGVSLRYKRIDVNEPIKNDVIAYIEAERLRRPLPPPPARLLYVLFHRLDTGAFYKAILNADKRTIVYAKELPKDVQVSRAIFTRQATGLTNRSTL
jgi:primary-amine oxidase